MKYTDLRDFIAALEQRGELVRIQTEVDPKLEMTEIADRTLRAGGPALLFENPKGYSTPVLANLFGTEQRVALGMGARDLKALREIGEILAYLRQPDAPKGMRDLWDKAPLLKQVLHMAPKVVRNPPCQYHAKQGADVDLNLLPIQTCWPGDAAPLITWPLVITRGPNKERQNLGIYRLQLLARNKLIMRWLSHRGGALDFREWQRQHPGTTLPGRGGAGRRPGHHPGGGNAHSRYAFQNTPSPACCAAARRNWRNASRRCAANTACRFLPPLNTYWKGYIEPGEMADEGPFGDHTGYYNEVERFPVFTVDAITHRESPIYHSTYTGRPPDEPAILGMALNEVFIPILQKQFPEIVDFYLPPEGCSYRLAVVTMRKEYPGHAKRVMLGVWSFLRQFMYTKFVIVTDDDVNARDWKDVIWAMTTRMDPQRDCVFIENTPIDYLDFASPVSGLGSKVGFDATNKWPGESQREWGRPIAMDKAVKQRIDELWDELGIPL